MIHLKFDEQERKILETLNQEGAMSPSRVSAVSWVMPHETMLLLETLNKEGMVLMREDTHSPDGKVVAITRQARHLLQEMNKQS